MSVTSWKKEFYPITATSKKIKTRLQAIKHSLQKWKGHLGDNLEKHMLWHTPLYFDAKNCSLCVKYRNFDSSTPCVKCPIYKHTGKDCNKEYKIYSIARNPNPMIKLLEKVLKLEQGK